MWRKRIFAPRENENGIEKMYDDGFERFGDDGLANLELRECLLRSTLWTDNLMILLEMEFRL